MRFNFAKKKIIDGVGDYSIAQIKLHIINSLTNKTVYQKLNAFLNLDEKRYVTYTYDNGKYKGENDTVFKKQ